MRRAEPRIGERVRAARQRLGWSRGALAFRSGLSSSAIAQVESGRRKDPRPSTLSALSQALGVTIDYLVRGVSSSPDMVGHRILPYSSDEDFVAAAGRFLAEGVQRSQPVLAVTSDRNIHLLDDHLGAGAQHIDFRESTDWYRTPLVALDAFRTFLDKKIDEGAPWVYVLGEPVWMGRSDSEIRLWAEYESLANMAFSTSPITIVCPYDERTLDHRIVYAARRTHPEIVVKEEVKPNPLYREPGAFVLADDPQL